MSDDQHFGSQSAIGGHSLGEHSPESDLKKIQKVQSFFRGWLCRRRWKQIVEEYIRSPHAESMRKRNSLVFAMVECEQVCFEEILTICDIPVTRTEIRCLEAFYCFWNFGRFQLGFLLHCSSQFRLFFVVNCWLCYRSFHQNYSIVLLTRAKRRSSNDLFDSPQNARTLPKYCNVVHRSDDFHRLDQRAVRPMNDITVHVEFSSGGSPKD